MRITFRMLMLTLAVVLFLQVTGYCQERYQPQDPQPNIGQPGAAPDLIEQLHLTPEQRLKIRAIREQTKEMRAAINQRLRESNLALEQALDADNLDEGILEQRMKETATAQVAQIRMRIQTEVSIRRVLNPEQIATLRSLRLQARGMGREPNQNQRPNRPAAEGLRPNQRNGIAPVFPRRNVARPNLRP